MSDIAPNGPPIQCNGCARCIDHGEWITAKAAAASIEDINAGRATVTIWCDGCAPQSAEILERSRQLRAVD